MFIQAIFAMGRLDGNRGWDYRTKISISHLTSYYHIPKRSCFRQIIQSMWQVEGTAAVKNEQINPKGIVEIIFNFSDTRSISSAIKDQQYQLSDSFINGFNTAPIINHLPENHVFFGVVFEPLAVKKIFRVPPAVFSNTTVEVTLLDPEFNSLWHQMREQADFKSRANIFLHWARKHLIEWHPQDQLFNQFLSENNQHGISVNSLANSLCYSPRQLSRKLLEVTAMNTEELLLYKKFLQAVDLLHETSLSLTAIAYECHFNDQSHFIKTFRKFTDTTPGDYKKRMSAVKGHTYEIVR